MTRSMEEEVSVMCNLSKGVREKGIAEGIIKGRAEGQAEGRTETTLLNIGNLMETLGLTVEQAMAALKVPENDRPKYVKLLNSR